MNDVLVTHEGAITTITLNRPSKKNALSREMYKTMADSIGAANDATTCKVIVIRAVGDTFCAGNEIAGFADHPHEPHLAETVSFMKSLLNCKKVVIAEVSGAAVGIGTTMLLHCDFVYCASEARFVMPFINLGLVPEFASSYVLPKIAGRRKASEWLLLGEPFGADEAYSFGLVNEVCAPDALAVQVANVAKKLAQKPNFALLQSKALLNSNIEDVEQHMAQELDVFVEALGTDAAQEAFDAFLKKRPINPEKFK